MPLTITEQIITTLQSIWLDQLQGIMLFGSRAQGNSRQNSDYDIAVLLDGKADKVLLWNSAQTLAAQLLQDVDLIDLRDATTVLQKEIIVSGQWLIKVDTFACDLFETHIISMYQQLQYDRQDILNDMLERAQHGRHRNQ